jgi:formylglycine-generating enzyme required for sulfatase activity
MRTAPAQAVPAPPLAPPPVRVSSAGRLRIGRTPITNAEYRPFVSAGLAPEPPWWRDPSFSSADQPVVGITWYEAAAYGEWLSTCGSGHWRLPTSAEWEWAARGGLVDAATPWGESLPAGEVPQGVLQGPWPVGRGTPNRYGLWDMGTIVHEWCSDVVLDPRSPDGERRLSCGGSWRHHVRWSPPSARSSLPPSFRYADYGFRLVLEPR